MILSQIELFKPEQMPGNELKLIAPTSAPTIGNTIVSCCGVSLYASMIEYATYLVKVERSNFNAMDIVHDALFVDGINETNFRQKIKSIFLVDRRISSSFQELNDFKKKPAINNILVCKSCQEPLPECAFRWRLINGGLRQLYCKCKKCESKEAVVRRQKRDRLGGLTTSQKYHLKKKKTDPNYLSKKVVQMTEFRKRAKEFNDV